MSRRLIAALCIALLAPLSISRPAAAQDKKSDAAKPTIAVFALDGPITESPVDETLALFGPTGVSLKDLTVRMRKAGDDPNVKAVVVLLEGPQVGIAQIEELRAAMKDVRAKGKEIYTHCDSTGTGGYVLLSGASRVSFVPTGDLFVNGIYAEQPFLRGLLDKLGVKPDFMTCGAYKSAAELFMRSEPSPEADAMMNWLLDGIDQTLVSLIAEGRKVDESKVRHWIDTAPYSARKAKDLGMIDALEFRQDFEQMLRTKYGSDIVFERKYGQDKSQQLDLSSPMAMFKIWGELLGGGSKKKKSDKPAVAIVYVEGAIIEGKGEDSPFSEQMAASTPIRKALDEAARDDSIKAVVLRVDSPGGSATGSEIILDATRRVKAKKPLVVSMGNVAGSGGYYVACGSETIFADRGTITGSIGVVFGKLVTTGMWDKVGIKFKPYPRGANAGILSSAEVFTPEQRQHMQGWMDEIYVTFKDHVTAIRGNKLKKPLDELAGGRVYTGQQALELGLIDKIGGLNDAVAFVAKQANLTDYDVRIVPEPKNFIEKIMEDAGGGKDDSKWLGLAGLGHGSIIELALPHLQGFDPQRVRVIVRTLRQLQTLQQEGVVLMMPEMVIGR